jgi:class 3 adenylate cyclase
VILAGREGRVRVHNGHVGLISGPVTLVFAGIEDCFRLREADPEAEAPARHNRIICQQIEGAGGRVFKAAGEAFRAVFAGLSAALVLAVAVRRAAGAQRWPPGLAIRVRRALHPGACAERDGDYFGPVVNRAARLLAAGHGGQVLVPGVAYGLVAGQAGAGTGFRDLGEYRLRDLAGPGGFSR